MELEEATLVLVELLPGFIGDWDFDTVFPKLSPESLDELPLTIFLELDESNSFEVEIGPLPGASTFPTTEPGGGCAVVGIAGPGDPGVP